MDAQKPVVTEQTDKRYKSIQAIGCLMVIAGIVLTVIMSPDRPGESTAGVNAGVLLMMFGAPVWLTGRVLGWWNHG